MKKKLYYISQTNGKIIPFSAEREDVPYISCFMSKGFRETTSSERLGSNKFVIKIPLDIGQIWTRYSYIVIEDSPTEFFELGHIFCHRDIDYKNRVATFYGFNTYVSFGYTESFLNRNLTPPANEYYETYTPTNRNYTISDYPNMIIGNDDYDDLVARNNPEWKDYPVPRSIITLEEDTLSARLGDTVTLEDDVYDYSRTVTGILAEKRFIGDENGSRFEYIIRGYSHND